MILVSPSTTSTSSPSPDVTRQLLTILAQHPQGLSVKELTRSLPRGTTMSAPRLHRGLKTLRSRGWTSGDRSGKVSLTPAAPLVTGRISFNRAGNAFIESPDAGTLAFVPAASTHGAFEGDRVIVQLEGGGSSHAKSNDRLPRARVLAVIDRTLTTVTGTVRCIDGATVLEPANRRLRQRLSLHSDTPLTPGLRVVARLSDAADPSVETPAAHVVRILGPETDARTDAALIADEYGLPGEFPTAVAKAAAQTVLPDASTTDRLDMRDQFVITIDPTTARDFDDALALRRLNAELWELWVHIADVSHFVRPGSALDHEALDRANSTYLAGRVVPMLPEHLSNGLCSLKPEADRLAFSAVLRLNQNGEVVGTRFKETLIRSKQRLTYATAQLALNGTERAACTASGLDRQTVRTVRDMAGLAATLRRRRINAGALVWDGDEIRPILDAEERLVSFEQDTDHEAHHLVEEFMLLANEAASRALTHAGISQLHRTHAAPETTRLAEATATLAAGGIEVEPLAPKGALARVLRQLAERDDSFVWTSTLLRALPKAAYSVTESGHFGLAKEAYAHFTSPIRRYPDLVTHRLLKGLLKKTGQIPSDHELEAVATHCSERETISQRAERHLLDIKLLRRLESAVRTAAPGQAFEGLVVAVYPNGCQIYLTAYRVMGWLPNVRTQNPPVPGQEVDVVPCQIDVTRGDLELAMRP